MNANSMKKVKAPKVHGGIKGMKKTKYHGAVKKHGKKGGRKGY